MEKFRAALSRNGSKGRKASAEPQPFRVVGIGASAGGFEALQELFASLQAETGLGFIVVQHLEPTHASKLAELHGHNAKMPGHEIVNGEVIGANHIFVLPQDRDVTVENGKLRLKKRRRRFRLHLHRAEAANNELKHAKCSTIRIQLY